MHFSLLQVSDWYARKGKKGEMYISVLNCFGGGVFFGTYLMHMAPEVREILEDNLLIPNDISYPLPELAIGFGFFLLLFVDKFVTIIAHKSSKDVVAQEEPAHGVHIRHMAHEHDHMTNSTANLANGSGVSEIKHEHGYKADGHLADDRAPSPRLVTRTDSVVNRSRQGSVLSNATHPAHTNAYTNHAAEKETQLSTISIDHKVNPEKQLVHEQTEDDELAARPYVFLIALSIDCIFEGMSLGLQDDAYGVWMLVIAILSHELVITFSFGLRLVKLFSTKKVAIIIIAYASTIPIGILIGFAIFETGGGSSTVDVVSGFFQAIAAGIFIYITFLEILNEEMTHDVYLSKPVAVLIGFVFMALMVLVENIENTGDDTTKNTTANAISSMVFS